MGGGRKPEGLLPPEEHYDEEEARSYTGRSRIAQIQRELTARALELLELPAPDQCVNAPLLLDIGCGSGLSGEVITEAGYDWLGLDIAPAMLKLAQQNKPRGDLIQADIGQTQNFREGLFDGAISVSVIQWLCHAFTKDQDPRRRLRTFFAWLYNSLVKGGRAALQFFPSHQAQTDMIAKAAKEAGFVGGIVVDHPDSEKKKKMFLLISVGMPTEGGGSLAAMAAGGGRAKEDGSYKPYGKKARGKRQAVTKKEWVLNKKAQQRDRGVDVRPDTKYTARKRKGAF